VLARRGDTVIGRGVVLDLKSVPTSQLDNFADQILAAPWDAYNVPASTFAHAIKSGKIRTEDGRRARTKRGQEAVGEAVR
jgi:hypothetical protein